MCYTAGVDDTVSAPGEVRSSPDTINPLATFATKKTSSFKPPLVVQPTKEPKAPKEKKERKPRAPKAPNADDSAPEEKKKRSKPNTDSTAADATDDKEDGEKVAGEGESVDKPPKKPRKKRSKPVVGEGKEEREGDDDVAGKADQITKKPRKKRAKKNATDDEDEVAADNNSVDGEGDASVAVTSHSLRTKRPCSYTYDEDEALTAALNDDKPPSRRQPSKPTPSLEPSTQTRVEVNYKGHGKWYPAVITYEHGDNTYDARYDEGNEVEVQVEASRIRGPRGKLDDHGVPVNSLTAYKQVYIIYYVHFSIHLI